MAQIVILIFLIVLAFFLIRGFARGNPHEKKMVYHSEIHNLPFVMEKCKEISISPPYAENIKDTHDLNKGHQNTVHCKSCLNQRIASVKKRYEQVDWQETGRISRKGIKRI